MRPIEDVFTPTIEPGLLLGIDLAFSQPPDARTLARRLEQARPDRRMLKTLVDFNTDHYFRRVLWRTPTCELVLACWLPTQGSPIHDHGGCEGATLLVLGSLEERLFAERDGGLLYRSSQSFEAGQIFLEHDATIHQVHNPASRSAVSLHLYAPPLRRFHHYADGDCSS